MSEVRIPTVDLILFDVDNTLYPADAGLWQHIDGRIQDYVADVLGLSLDQAKRVQKQYWLDYGTTIAGLIALHDIDPAPYMEYVHDIDARAYLQPNVNLGRMLARLPHRKAAFTNATASHAFNILTALGIEGNFERLIGMDTVGYISKPDPRAYERCLEILQIAPERCLFIDDSPKNLVPAKAMGMWTIWLGENGDVDADYTIQRIEELGEILGLDGQESYQI